MVFFFTWVTNWKCIIKHCRLIKTSWLSHVVTDCLEFFFSFHASFCVGSWNVDLRVVCIHFLSLPNVELWPDVIEIVRQKAFSGCVEVKEKWIKEGQFRHTLVCAAALSLMVS